MTSSNLAAGLEKEVWGNGHEGYRPEGRLLVDCMAGSAAAWQHLYETCHPALLRSIGALLGPARRNRHLIEEIGARVWYTLATNPSRLLRQFEPTRASFNT